MTKKCSPIIDHLQLKFGGQKALAKAAECAQQTVSGWRDSDRVPSKRMEILLKNAKTLGIDLSPEDFFEVPQKQGEAA